MAPPQYETQPSETSSIQEVREYYFNTLQVEEHAATFNLNTTAVLLTTFAFLELLDAGNKVNEAAGSPLPKSQVVTVSSAGAFFRGYGDFVYNASKAATTHMMKHMATALGPWDIRCNVIAPGCKLYSLSCKAFNLLNCRVSFTHYGRTGERVRTSRRRDAESSGSGPENWCGGGDGWDYSVLGIEGGRIL